jgi:DNA-binding phage protein
MMRKHQPARVEPHTQTGDAGDTAALVARLRAAGGEPHDFAAVAQTLRDDPCELAAWLTDALNDPDHAGQWADFDFAVKAFGATKLARAAGLSQPTVSKAFGPNRQPGFDVAVRIIKAMGLEIVIRPSTPEPVAPEHGSRQHEAAAAAPLAAVD